MQDCQFLKILMTLNYNFLIYKMKIVYFTFNITLADFLGNLIYFNKTQLDEDSLAM